MSPCQKLTACNRSIVVMGGVFSRGGRREIINPMATT